MGAHKLHQGATGARRLMGRKLAFQLPEVVNQFARDDHQQQPICISSFPTVILGRGRKCPMRGMIYDRTCSWVYLTRPSVYKTSFSENQRGLKDIS